jgi:hypothetical protein
MAKQAKRQAGHQTPALRTFAKDEMNLAEFPIGKLGVRDSRETLTYEGWFTDKTGRRFKQKWLVSGSKEYGLPHELGNRILVAFITLAAEQQSKEVSFVDHQMLKLLRLSRGKANYQHFERNLLQLAGLTIYSEQAFWDNEEKRHITTKRAFHILEDVWLSSWAGDASRGPKRHGYVVFNDVFWRSIESGYLKTLNMELYLGTLKSSIARQLYRCLDKLMRYRSQFEIDVFDLANRIGLKQYEYPSKIKEKLQPALRELINIGFLESATFFRVAQYTRIRFVKITGQKAIEQREPDQPGTSLQEKPRTPINRRQQIHDRYGVSKEYQELWLKVLEGIKAHIRTATFDSFIEQTILLSIEDGTATVLTGKPNALDWLQNRFIKQFKDELNYHLRSAGEQPVSSVKIEAVTEQQE